MAMLGTVFLLSLLVVESTWVEVRFQKECDVTLSDGSANWDTFALKSATSIVVEFPMRRSCLVAMKSFRRCR